jgi:hypothetical protein
MERLLHRNIIIINCSRRVRINMITIGKPIMSYIMTHSCQNKTKRVKFIQSQFILHFTRLKHIVTHLHHINSMQIIVILNWCIICCLYFIKEMNNFIIIENWSQSAVVKNSKRKHWQENHSFIYLVSNLEQVEVQASNIAKFFGLLFHLVHKAVEGGASS